MNGGAPIGTWLPAFVLGLLIAAVSARLLVTLLMRLTRGLTEAGDAFFNASKSHNYTAALRCLSAEFRAHYGETSLRGLVTSLGLSDARHPRWMSRRIVNSHGYLHGRLLTPRGDPVSVWLVLVKRQGRWMIHALRKPAPGLLAYFSPSSSRPQEPPP